MGKNHYILLFSLYIYMCLQDVDAQRRRRNRQQVMTASWETKLYDEGTEVTEYGDAREVYDQNNAFTGRLVNISSSQMPPNSKYSDSVIKYYFEESNQEHVPGTLIVVVNVTMSTGENREICMVRDTSVGFDRAMYELSLRGGSPFPIFGVDGGHFTVTIPKPRVPTHISRLCQVMRRRRGRRRQGRIRLLLTPTTDAPKADDIRISGLIAENHHVPIGNHWPMYVQVQHERSASITIDKAAIEPLVKELDTRRSG